MPARKRIIKCNQNQETFARLGEASTQGFLALLHWKKDFQEIRVFQYCSSVLHK
jgi:hypothetical protein